MTSRELAALAGVSQSTVSRVLNNAGNVSEQKRRKVLELARSCSFELNINAKGLRTHKLNRVGILLSPNFRGFDENLFWAMIYSKLHIQLQEMGYTAFPVYNYQCSAKEILNKVIGQKQADFMILISTNHNYTDDDLKILFDKKVDFVCLYDRLEKDCCCAQKKINVIELDFREAGRIAGKFLTEQGHGKIALQLNEDDRSSESRCEGFRQGLKAAGADYCLTEIGDAQDASPITFQGGYQTARKNIDILKKCTAVFAVNDAAAIGMLAALQEYGMKVPEDISIVGVNNIAMCTWWRPHLTTVAFDVGEIVKNACDMLFGSKEKTKKAVVMPKLLVRDSVKTI